MHNSESSLNKKLLIAVYIIVISVFCTNSIIFEEGLLVGFLAGVVWFAPSFYLVFAGLAVIAVQAFAGAVLPYLILFSVFILIAVALKYFPIKNNIVSVVTYCIFYLPVLFLFQLTALFHILNFAVCIITAILSEKIIRKISGTGDFADIFLNKYHCCFILFIIGLGSISMSFWKIDVFLMLFSLFALALSEITDEKTALWSLTFYCFAGYIAGCGYAMLFLAVGGIIIYSFVEFGKVALGCLYFTAVLILSLLITDLAFDFYSSIISCSIGILLFLILPCKKIRNHSKKGKYASQNEIINRDRSKISFKIDELASCFCDIADSYKKIANQSSQPSKMMKYITSETVASTCGSCEKRDFCEKNNLQRLAEIDYLAHCAQTKSKTTVLDIGDYISAYCIKKVELLSAVNNSSNEVNKQNLKNEEKAKSKEEIASIYTSVAKVLHKVSIDASKKLSFDFNAELQIAQSLDKADIFYKELFLYQNENKCICVEMLANNDDAGLILNCIEKVFKSRFECSSVSHDTSHDVDYMIFAKSPNIKIDYGVKTKPKKQNSPNGDSLTILNLPNGKFVCGICDGMGSGENAHEFSKKAISFIENLFKASFPTSDIVASVNSFMESCDYNSYATLDILEIDLYKQQAYLYKVGSPDSYYKSQKTHVISSKALPIGIMKEIKLEINSFKLFPRDRIVISSDGVLDFMREEIKNGIRSKNWLNSQIFTEEIMNGCDKKMKGGFSDDRSIITIEIMENA
ncbi:MAG: SpoIIE family protein phosphatase [Bacillota bacterium]